MERSKKLLLSPPPHFPSLSLPLHPSVYFLLVGDWQVYTAKQREWGKEARRGGEDGGESAAVAPGGRDVDMSPTSRQEEFLSPSGQSRHRTMPLFLKSAPLYYLPCIVSCITCGQRVVVRTVEPAEVGGGQLVSRQNLPAHTKVFPLKRVRL